MSWWYIALFLAVFGESTIIVGAFVPGLNSIIVASFLASHGELNIALVIIAAWLGMFAGDFLGYILGRYLLDRLPTIARAFHKARPQVEQFVTKHHRLMVFYQFIGFARSPLPVLLGSVEHPLRAWLWLLARATTIFVSILSLGSYALGHAVSEETAIIIVLGVQTSMLLYAGWVVLQTYLQNRRKSRSK